MEEWEGKLDILEDDTGITLTATVEKWGAEHEVSIKLRELLKQFDGKDVTIAVRTAEPLRVCRDCGKKAYTKKDLEEFSKQKGAKHDRLNLCRECSRERRRKQREETEVETSPREEEDPGMKAYQEPEPEKPE